jgi:hypothetical protein
MSSAIYHGENKLLFDEMMMKPDFVLDQHTELYFYSVRSMQKQSASTCKHDMQYGHINLTNSIILFFTYLI